MSGPANFKSSRNASLHEPRNVSSLFDPNTKIVPGQSSSSRDREMYLRALFDNNRSYDNIVPLDSLPDRFFDQDYTRGPGFKRRLPPGYMKERNHPTDAYLKTGDLTQVAINGKLSKNVFDLRPPPRPDTSPIGPDEPIESFVQRAEENTQTWMQTPEYKAWQGRVQSWELANYLGAYRKKMDSFMPVSNEVLAWRIERQRRAEELLKTFQRKKIPNVEQFNERFDP